MATESPDDGCRLVPLKQRALPQHIYGKGVSIPIFKQGVSVIGFQESCHTEGVSQDFDTLPGSSSSCTSPSGLI